MIIRNAGKTALLCTENATGQGHGVAHGAGILRVGSGTRVPDRDPAVFVGSTSAGGPQRRECPDCSAPILPDRWRRPVLPAPAWVGCLMVPVGAFVSLQVVAQCLAIEARALP